MRAMVYEAYGTPDRLRLQEVQKPAPKDDEVLIKVAAASVNSWDWDLVRGVPFLTRLDGGLIGPRHRIIGCDIAGEVEAVGRNAARLKPGDAVFGDISGCGWGGFAEYVGAREDVLALKPAGMSFEEAAAVPQAGVLALQGLRKYGELRTGHRVLINGAGGGVGTFALQIAKLFGAEVTCVDCGEKLAMLRSLGADRVVDYTVEDFTASGERYDLVLDVTARRPLSAYQRALGPSGVLVVIGGATGLILRLLLFSPKRTLGVLLHKPNREDLAYLSGLCEAGKLKPVIGGRYPLARLPEAIALLGAGGAKGKLVISMEANR